MDDLHRRFAALDRVPVPDVWLDVERRLEALDAATPGGRLVPTGPRWRAAQAERDRHHGAGNRRPRMTMLLAAASIAVVGLGTALAVGSGWIRLTSIAPTPTDVAPAVSAPPDVRPTSTPTPSPSGVAPRAGFPARPGTFAQVADWRPVSDTVGWVATSAGILRTTDHGATWSNVRPSADGLAATAFVDPDTTYLATSGPSRTLSVTHDGGGSWLDVRLDLGNVNGGPVFSFGSPLRGSATFFSADGANVLRVYRTIDGGLSWTGPFNASVPHLAASSDTVNGPLGGFLWQRAGKADGQPFDNRFFLSADGAATWTQYRFPVGPLAPADGLKEIVGLAPGDGGRINMAIRVNGGEGAVYESTEDPAAWRLVATLPGPDVQLLSATTWVVAMGHGEFRSTTDAGAHWRTTVTGVGFREVPRFATVDTAWVTVSCNPDSILPQDPHCDGITKEGTMYVTSDGGATWTRVDR